jgi:hypothetical protein
MSSNFHDDLIAGPVITGDDRSGRATWDERGNSVWEWQVEPGVYSREADTQRVRALQLVNLELLESSAGRQSWRSEARGARDYPSRAGIDLPDRGNHRPVTRPQR